MLGYLQIRCAAAREGVAQGEVNPIEGEIGREGSGSPVAALRPQDQGLSGADLESALLFLNRQDSLTHKDQFVGCDPAIRMASLAPRDKETSVAGLKG